MRPIVKIGAPSRGKAGLAFPVRLECGERRVLLSAQARPGRLAPCHCLVPA